MPNVIARKPFRLKSQDPPEEFEIAVSFTPQFVPDQFTKDPIYEWAKKDGDIMEDPNSVTPPAATDPGAESKDKAKK